MTIPLKVPETVPSSCLFRPAAGKGAFGHCGSPMPSHTFVNSPFIKL